MQTHRHSKWIVLAGLTLGTVFQISACREDVALFGLRTFFSAYTVPINYLIQQILFGLVPVQ